MDADFKDGFVCRENKSIPKPQCQTDADCPSGQQCQNQARVARE